MDKNLNRAEKVYDGQKIYIPSRQLTQSGWQAKIEQSIYSKNMSQSDLIKTDWMTFEVVNSGLVDNNENSLTGILNYENNKIFLVEI